MSGPENKSLIRVSLISAFGLFCLGNTDSNLEPENNLSNNRVSLISGLYCIYIYIYIYIYIVCLKIAATHSYDNYLFTDTRNSKSAGVSLFLIWILYEYS